MRGKELTAGDDVIYRPAGERGFKATVEKVNKTTVRIAVHKFGFSVMMTVPKGDVFGIVVALFAERPPKKPGPTWQWAGEVAGEKSTKFSKWFARGAWQ